MKVQSIQPTPNPNAFKFVVDGILFDGTRNYTGRDQAAGHALAEELFTIDGVETLFFCDRFVTLSMTPDADWRAVHEKATRIIEDSEPIEVAPQPAGPSAEGGGGACHKTRTGPVPTSSEAGEPRTADQKARSVAAVSPSWSPRSRHHESAGDPHQQID